MKFMYDLNGLTCRACNKELENETVIKANSIGHTYCCECAKSAVFDPDLYSYINDRSGQAVLTLDQTTYKTVADMLSSAAECKNIREFDGTIDTVNMEHNAIIIVELPVHGKRLSPQQTLINANDDLYRMSRVAIGSHSEVVRKDSRATNRTYIFYNSETPEQAYRNLCAVADELRKMNQGAIRTVYMERCHNDTCGIARLLLANSGYSCVYCSGINKLWQKTDKLFGVDFTREELFQYCRSRIIGQDKELSLAVYLVYDFVENAALGMKRPALNWLLTAPSGMGKTEFFRCVRDFFRSHGIPIPVVQIDLSQITETGFKGKDAEAILSIIHSASPSGKAKLPSGTAICFLDEADKKFMVSYDSHGKNVNANAQASLLTLVEGSVMEIPDEGGDFNTSNTMFVFMGAFQELRNKKQENGNALRRIFSGEDNTEGFEDCFFDDIKLEDMISDGMLEELAGRITLSINFHKLSEDDMRGLIRTKAEQLSGELGISIELESQAVEDLVSIAYSNLGVRTPVNKLTELIYSALAERTDAESYDSSREVIVIKDKNSTEIKPKEKVTLSKSAC